jgi:hypothetical protein
VLGEREGPLGPALTDTEPRDSVGGRGPAGISYIIKELCEMWAKIG